MAETKNHPEVQADPRRRREDWIARVSALANQVSRWSEAEGWAVERHERTITERPRGTYVLPELSVRLTGGEVLLVPVGLDVAGGNGRVDLEAVPTLARIKIMDTDQGWALYADTNVPLRMKWNRQNFVRLAHDLLS
jgi:hypothetical protein